LPLLKFQLSYIKESDFTASHRRRPYSYTQFVG